MSVPSKHGKKASRLALVIALLAVIGGSLFGMHAWEKQREKQAAEALPAEDPLPNERASVYYDGAWYRLRDDLETFLIMGLDKTEETINETESYNNKQQADFLLLMIVDKTHGSYTALHINRDTMAEIQRLGLGGKKLNTFTGQLALAHTYGSGGKDSCRNTVKAVSRFLYDAPVDHYFSVTMDAIPVLNDLVGGVTVHVDDDLTAADPVLVQGTDVTLHGDQALHFVRARTSVTDGTNLSRMNRQRVFLDALYTQMRTRLQNDSRFALSMANRLAEYSTSDLIPEELSELAERLKDEEFRGILSTMGEAVEGEKYIEFYPDETRLKESVLQIFFEPA